MLGVVCLSGWIICLALGELWFEWVQALGLSFFGMVFVIFVGTSVGDSSYLKSTFLVMWRWLLPVC